MSSFRQQLAPLPAHRSRAGPSKPFAPAPAILASVPPPAPRPQQGDALAAGPLTCQEKRKWHVEFTSTNPHVVNPESLMADLRGEAREAQAGDTELEKLTEIATI